MLVLVFLASAVGFIAWLAYVSYRDPAGIFRPRPRDGDTQGDAGHNGDDKADPGT